MADWSKPTLADGYVNFLVYLKALSNDLAKGNDPAKVMVANPFADMTRFNSASFRWEIYNGTTWGALSSSYDINVTTLGGKAASLYALLKSPVFTDQPQCPTADAAANNQLLANTAFVQLIKAALIDNAPTNLNTINKLAASLGNDPAFATTYSTAWTSHLAAVDPHAQYALDSELSTHAGTAASTTVAGHTRLATTAETITGTASNIATHPAGVAAAIAAAMSSVSGGGGIQVFTANGTFTVPSGVATIYVTAVAGGGGGRGSTGAIYGGGGGGGGGRETYPLSVTPGQVLSIVIGAGGAGGVSGANGSAGGSTSIGALLSLSGGGGGTATAGGSGGSPGGGSGGLGSGNSSTNTAATNGSGGGAGGGAGHPAGYANCGAAGSGVGGAGGSSTFVSYNSASAGLAGGYYGGGGGGSWSGGAGGNGAPGIAIIQW